MKRRAVWAILKVVTCALLLPGCAGLRLFQKDESVQDPKKTETAITKSASLSRDDLIPKHPKRDLFTEEDDGSLNTSARQRPEEPPAQPKIELVAISSKPDATPADDPLVKALEAVLKNRHNEALKYLDAFDAATQDLLLRLLPLLATFKDKGLDKLSREEVGNLHEQLEGLLNALRPRTDLVIDTLCFCEGLKGFGDYTPLPDNPVFRPGDVAWLYAGLRNFCAAHRDAFCEMRLSSRLRISDPKNPDFEPIEFPFDESHQAVRAARTLNSYYQSFRFPIPRLPPGLYTLTLTITDESQPGHRRVADKSLEFRMTSPAARMP